MNLCVSYLWFTFYYTTFEITPRHLLWQFDTHLLYIFILVIIFVRGCFYTIHDALKLGGIFEFLFEKMSEIALFYGFQKTGDLEKEFILFNLQRKNEKIKWCIKHDIVLCTTIWGEYSNVYFLVIFFIYQVVALFSLANDSYILLFKNDSYKSKHFIGKTFFYVSTINHIPFQF